MPLDAPPPLPPPPTAGGPPPPGPTQVDALSDLAGMGAGNMDMVSTLRMAAEFLSQAMQLAQGTGDRVTAMQLAQALNAVTTIAQAQLQGPMAGPMAGNGLGAPPPPGVMAPAAMTSPSSATPAPMPG